MSIQLYFKILFGGKNMQNLFGNAQSQQIFGSILMYAVVILGLYLVMFRPNQKRKKQMKEL